MAADPVSWKVIEKGWDVVDAGGEPLGKVVEVTGDTEADIFDGLAVSIGTLSANRYVPSEQVAEIREGQVRLALSRTEAEQLEPFAEPAPQERILPEGVSWWDRLTSAFRGR